MNLLISFAIILSVTAFSWGSPAKQCDGLNFEGLTERITVKPCGKTKCNLPKGHNITVIFKFKPLAPVKTLVNNVHAKLFDIPFPFIGVDATDACKDIYHAEDNSPAPCPLEAGKEYIYTNVFFIESVYPEVPMRVHWSLEDKGTSVICFEIPAEIVSKKKKIKTTSSK